MKRIHSLRFSGVLLVGVLILSCGGGKKEQERDTQEVSEAQVSAEGLIGSESMARAEALLAESMAGGGSGWDGPVAGPPAQGERLIIFVGSDMTNGGVLAVSRGTLEAVEAIGWRMDIFDGKGSANEQIAAFDQAVARQPDGIVIGGWYPSAAGKSLEQAEELGIPIVGWHAVSEPGPSPEFNLFFNITTDALDVARTAAIYAVAHSKEHTGGRVRAVVFTDSNYQIAIDKADAMRDTVLEFGGTILEYIDTPIAETSSRMPTVTSRLLQEYGEDFYALAINDNYFTGMKSSLKQQGFEGAGPPYNISAGDGDAPAFARIRSTDYQTATVPEPLYMQGWQLVDELNRAIAGEPDSGYIAPVFVIDSSNIGSDDVYDPAVGYRDAYRGIWGK